MCTGRTRRIVRVSAARCGSRRRGGVARYVAKGVRCSWAGARVRQKGEGGRVARLQRECVAVEGGGTWNRKGHSGSAVVEGGDGGWSKRLG